MRRSPNGWRGRLRSTADHRHGGGLGQLVAFVISPLPAHHIRGMSLWALQAEGHASPAIGQQNDRKDEPFSFEVQFSSLNRSVLGKLNPPHQASDRVIARRLKQAFALGES